MYDFKTRLKTLQLSSLYFWVRRLFFEFKTRHSNINPRYCIEWWSFHFSSGVLLYFFLCNFKLTWPILSILQKNLRKIFKIPQTLLLIKTTKRKYFCLKLHNFESFSKILSLFSFDCFSDFFSILTWYKSVSKSILAKTNSPWSLRLCLCNYHKIYS